MNKNNKHKPKKKTPTIIEKFIDKDGDRTVIEQDPTKKNRVLEFVYRPNGKTIRMATILIKDTREIVETIWFHPNGKIVESSKSYKPDGKLDKLTQHIIAKTQRKK
ncbi:hypothetical protein S231_02140 [Candidatus Phytoplasma solani]|nr:hypothetical protein S231_02140 [Candidatus Phytoplasma solani]